MRDYVGFSSIFILISISIMPILFCDAFKPYDAQRLYDFQTSHHAHCVDSTAHTKHELQHTASTYANNYLINGLWPVCCLYSPHVLHNYVHRIVHKLLAVSRFCEWRRRRRRRMLLTETRGRTPSMSNYVCTSACTRYTQCGNCINIVR